MDEPIHDGFGDHRIFKQFDPSLGLDLGSDDEGSLVVTLFEDVHQGSGLLMGVVSKSQVIEDQNLGLDEATDVVEVAAGGLGGLDFLEQEIDRQKLRGMAFLTEPFTESDSEMSFTQPGFADDQEIFLVMEEAELRELFDLGFGQILVEGEVQVFQVGAEAKASLGHKRLGGAVFARQKFLFEQEAEELQGMELLGQSDLCLSFAGFMDAEKPHLVREISDLIKHHDGETSRCEG